MLLQRRTPKKLQTHGPEPQPSHDMHVLSELLDEGEWELLADIPDESQKK